MGRVFFLDLEGSSYRCIFCYTPLALADHVLSRSFSCSRGRAYLFSKVVNVTVGPQVDRLMISGLHTVEDIFCCCCGQIMGWKYVVAHEKSEVYKEGKFVLERWRIVDDIDEELNLDGHASSSDTENT
ncbi:protein yippee-like At5g53940 [Cicer arietinum]|uniref:Protein yippee-like n=1 Tax=Cicer arietinum TaxID=3827 RepID=A0A1S2YHZ1_CICAR|nr:protein yippee-like At5g53940 [Cicer arietinum]